MADQIDWEPVKEWETCYVPEGTFLDLLYLTPTQDICQADVSAYEELVSNRNIVNVNDVTAAGYLSELHAKNIPTTVNNGQRRVSDNVWAALVIVVKPGYVSHIVPKTLRPCSESDSKTFYQLQAVTKGLVPTPNFLKELVLNADNETETVAHYVADTIPKQAGQLPKKLASLIETPLVLALLVLASYWVVTRHKGGGGVSAS